MKTAQKARKPRPDFPLFPHANGHWAKKVRGNFEYFGSVKDDPKGERALNEWLDQKDNLLAGRRRRIPSSALTVRDLCNKLLNCKRVEMQAGLVKLRSIRTWIKVCSRIVAFLGANRPVEDIGPQDFEGLMETFAGYAPSTRSEWVTYVRALFIFAYNDEQRLISQPVLFGRAFRRVKHHRQNGPGRAFTADEIQKFLLVAGAPMRAMILLGVNCGFGNNDCATLTFDKLDLERGWHSHARPKTGVPRRCPLWNETIAAIRDFLKRRQKPRDESNSGLVFLTERGFPFVRLSSASAKRLAEGKVYATDWIDTVGTTARKMLKHVEIKRKGLSFYSLRHTFETIGGGAKDQVAVDLIMGHVTPGMGTTYRDSISDERLRAVTDHVHDWLFSANTLTDEKELQCESC